MAVPPKLAPIYRSTDLRAVEAAAKALPLMERAGLAAADVAQAIAGARNGSVLVLAGPGNNGGDAFVVARRLREAFFDVMVVYRGDPATLPTDAAAARGAWVGTGGTTVEDIPAGWAGSLIVDGLFGIGLARAIAPLYVPLVDWANASGRPILALDIPSGVGADTGMTLGPAIHATATATFIALKPGLLTGVGVDLCGEVSVHSLGIDPEPITPAMGHRLEWPALAALLPATLRRDARNVHKGTFGTLGIVGGAHGMVGAPLLAGRAALLTGAGKVWIGFVATKHPAVDWAQPELMLRAADQVLNAGLDALICGPGLGNDEVAGALVARAINVRAPLVLDADALNVIAANPALAAAVAARHSPTVITPHPAEAARLLGVTTASIQADRLGAARTLAARLGAAVVIKGAGSVLAYPDGTWDINTSGNPGLASAGTGDVLTGFAGAFLAQRQDAMTALRLAVCLHGAAADLCVRDGRGPLGLTASEIAPAARSLLNGAAGRESEKPSRV